MESGLIELFYQDLLGKDFAYGGRGPDVYDCAGLVGEICRRLGKVWPVDYVSNQDPCMIQWQITTTAEQEFVEIEKPEPFCAVTFFIRPHITSHIGMVLPDCKRFIHIMHSCKVAIERLENPSWKRRNTGFWKHKTW